MRAWSPVLCIVLAGGTVLAGQERPKFRVATRLVEVSVIVLKDGKPVTGLTANDFRLSDGGQEQRIEFFSTDSEATVGPMAAPSSVPPPAPAGAHEFSNRVTTNGGATVILFDRLNTRFQDQAYARDHLLNFLRQIRSGDRVGIYVLDGDSIRVLHDFTNDASSLVRALARYHAMTSRELAGEEAAAELLEGGGDPELDAELGAFIKSASANMAAHYTGLRSDATAAAMETIANHLAAVQGRKNLIWVSSGFPLDAFRYRGRDPTAAIQQATRPLNDANVTMYGVDARGLVGAITYGAGGRATFTTLAMAQGNADVLHAMSEATGGRTFSNTNDINGAVRRAIDDSYVTYTLGYYPAHGKWDGAYRSIKVKVARPGVEVRHRKGYFAGVAPSSPVTRGSAPAETARRRAIRSALLSPLEATEIGLTAQLERVPGTSSDVKVIIKTVAGGIAFEQKGDFWEGQLDIVIAQKLADGTAPKNVERTATVRVAPDRYQETRTQGLKVDAQVTLLPNVQRLHIIVHDVTSGNTGSIVVQADRLRALLR